MNLKQKQTIKGYALLIPIILLVTVFMFYPFLRGIRLSFFGTKYGYGAMDFVGLKNYLKILSNDLFPVAIKNSLVWVAATMALNMVVPTFIGILMNRNYRGKQVSIAAILIPWLTPVVGIALISRWLLEPQVGVINTFLKTLGIVDVGINFIGSTQWAFPVMIVLNFWQFCPLGILLTLSALSTIQDEHYEAMRIDGASEFQIFQHLILPAIGKTLGFLAYFGVAFTFNSYGMTYLVTKGGPSYATYTLPIMVYEKTFKNINIGQATALATIIGVFLIVLGVLFFKYVYKTEE